MEKKLKRIYTALVTPSLAGFLFFWYVNRIGLPADAAKQSDTLLTPLLFTAAALFALGLPICYRAYFAYRKQTGRHISQTTFYVFQRNLLYIVLVTPYIALLMYGLHLSRFHQMGTLLMALYGVYYFYPSRKRLAQERKIFGVPDKRKEPCDSIGC